MLETQAISDVSLNFEAGKIHGIIGPDGAGKTTLIRLIAGLLKPISGKIEYFENIEDISKHPICHCKQTVQARHCGLRPAISDLRQDCGSEAAMTASDTINQIPDSLIRKRVAYLPQEQSLYADLSCMEHLEFFSNIYNMSRKDFKEKSAKLLEMVGLSKFADRKAGNLSGGMYKKLGVICVLLNSPDLLLLDEPTIGVDPLSRRDLWELIHGISNEMTVICSTSYMDEAEKCDKVHILNEGKVLASDLPDNIKKQFNVKKIEEVFLL